MKTTYKLFTLLAAVSLMTSCRSDDELLGSQDQGYLELNATIENEVGSRASINATTFEKGDTLGVFLKQSPYPTYISSVRSIYDGSTWKFDTPVALPENDTTVYAVYAYNTVGIIDTDEHLASINTHPLYSKIGTTTAVDNRFYVPCITVDATKQINYLYGSAKVSKTNYKANINFKHAMAKVTFYLTSKTSDELVSARLDNAYVSGKLFPTYTGDLDANTATTGTIVSKNVNTTGSASTAEFLMIPNAAEQTVTITYTYKNAGTYTAKVTIPILSMGKSYTMTVKDDTSIEPHDYVDLGLPSGTLWATCNVGASSPEEYGLYFAWGETTGYTSDTSDGHNFNWTNYTLCNGSSNTMTKYCISSSYGTVDAKAGLEPADDAATVNWGSDWQMPSLSQVEELINNTNHTNTTVKGVYGSKFVSTKDNSKYIFLPAAGDRTESIYQRGGNTGVYWTRSLNTSEQNKARLLDFGKTISGFDFGCGTSDSDPRFCGHSIRPVRISK